MARRRSLKSQRIAVCARHCHGTGTGARVRKSTRASPINIVSHMNPSAEVTRVRLRASVSCMNTDITSNVFVTEIPKLRTVLTTPSFRSAVPALSASRANGPGPAPPGPGPIPAPAGSKLSSLRR